MLGHQVVVTERSRFASLTDPVVVNRVCFQPTWILDCFQTTCSFNAAVTLIQRDELKHSNPSSTTLPLQVSSVTKALYKTASIRQSTHLLLLLLYYVVEMEQTKTYDISERRTLTVNYKKEDCSVTVWLQDKFNERKYAILSASRWSVLQSKIDAMLST